MAATDARRLAQQLSARDERALAALLAARGVAPNADWSDAFDAADRLLEPASLARALTDLTAAETDALDTAIARGRAAASPERDALIARGLLDDEGAPWEATEQVVAAAPRVASTPGKGEGAETPAPARDGAETPAAQASDAADAERAFTASASLADLLQTALATPLARIGAGTLGAVDRRRLIDSGAVADATAADELVAIAERVGLIAGDGRALLVTEAGLAWLHTSTLQRWTEVAERLIAGLPAAVRRPGGGWLPLAQWPGAHPFDPAWPARAEALAGLLRRWAIVGPQGDATTWAAPAAEGATVDAAALAALLPPEVDRVYLQNDLTAIAPGSLAPELDMRLRGMARRESRAQASSYRFTAETLSDALTADETAETIRAFLTDLSLTGLPQPLAYEIERSAARLGALRVGPVGQGRTRVTSDDEALLRTVEVDQALRPLGLVPDGGALVTRSSADTAFWMIADARYPVVAVDADGQRRTLDRHRLAPPPEPAPDPLERYAGLVARIRAQDGDADAAWLGRELEQAVRSRAVIVVSVRQPDPEGRDPAGTEREFTIEALGLGGGRLRGRDRTVDVERTLPVTSIIRVTPA